MESHEPEFRAWRRRRLKTLCILCAIGVPAGFAFLGSSPAITVMVSGLSVIIASLILATLNEKDDETP